MTLFETAFAAVGAAMVAIWIGIVSTIYRYNLRRRAD